jgi:hypothetical protein
MSTCQCHRSRPHCVRFLLEIQASSRVCYFLSPSTCKIMRVALTHRARSFTNLCACVSTCVNDCCPPGNLFLRLFLLPLNAWEAKPWVYVTGRSQDSRRGNTRHRALPAGALGHWRLLLMSACGCDTLRQVGRRCDRYLSQQHRRCRCCSLAAAFAASMTAASCVIWV